MGWNGQGNKPSSEIDDSNIYQQYADLDNRYYRLSSEKSALEAENAELALALECFYENERYKYGLTDVEIEELVGTISPTGMARAVLERRRKRMENK